MLELTVFWVHRRVKYAIRDMPPTLHTLQIKMINSGGPAWLHEHWDYRKIKFWDSFFRSCNALHDFKKFPKIFFRPVMLFVWMVCHDTKMNSSGISNMCDVFDGGYAPLIFLESKQEADPYELFAGWREEGKANRQETQFVLPYLPCENSREVLLCISPRIPHANRFLRSFSGRFFPEHFLWESLNGGLANGGFRCLSRIVHDCLRLLPFCDESSLRKGPKKGTKVHNCRRLRARVALSPHLRAPI